MRITDNVVRNADHVAYSHINTKFLVNFSANRVGKRFLKLHAPSRHAPMVFLRVFSTELKEYSLAFCIEYKCTDTDFREAFHGSLSFC